MLLGPDGNPTSSQEWAAKKRGPGRPPKPRPITDEAFGNWMGRPEVTNIPGLEAIQFDTSRLTIADYRKMSEHYQINSSLMVLSFMLHQLDWHIECDDPKVAAQANENLSKIWTRLVRSMSSAFKFGYSPNVVQWENVGRHLEITKIKDLLHEECSPKWKIIDGPQLGDLPIQKFKVYDGIEQWGSNPIPVENSFWYPLLMENGDYGGRKLLRSAFQPWFFSSLIHLYQNRYFERFGEPVPIGRAPYEDKIKVGNQTVSGPDLMKSVLGMVRNGSAVVLPSDRTQEGSNNTDRYDYTVEYLESQMRGADFERYLTRLDEEMSLALFTPLLLMRTADSGGYNQGIAHTQVYLWMLNAISGDLKEYIDKYILKPIALYNFGTKAKLPTIKFRKLGVAQQETLRSIVQALIARGEVKPDVTELGQHIGLDLEEIDVLAGNDNGEGEGIPGVDTRDRTEKLKKDGERGVDNPRSTSKLITQRLEDQASKAYREGRLDSSFIPSIGYQRQLADTLEAHGVHDAAGAAATFTERATEVVTDLAGIGTGENGWGSFDEFNKHMKGAIGVEFGKIIEVPA